LKNSLNLVTLYIVAFFGFASFNFLVPVIPLYADTLGASVSQVGLIVGAISYVAAFLLIPLGVLSDRFGRRNLLVGGLIVFTLAPLLYSLASNPQQLILVRAIHGLAPAAFIPAAITMVVDSAPEAKRGEAIGWYTTLSQLGLMAGPVAGGFLADHLGFDAAFYGCSAISLLGLVFALTRLGAIVHRPVTTPDGASSSWRWLVHPFVIAVLLVFLMVGVGVGTLSGYIPLYGIGFGLTETDAGLIITAMFGSSALLRVPAGRLSDRVDRKLLFIVGLAVSAIAVALFPFFQGLWQFIVIGVIFGIGMGIAMPSSLATVADFSPVGGRGLSMSITVCFFHIGLAVGPTAMGFVAEKSNFETMFLACAASLAVGLFIMLGLIRTRQKTTSIL